MRLAAVLLLASAAMGADPATQKLFDQVRDKVLDNTRRVPRYTCVQTINRNQYRPQYGRRPSGCEAIIGAREKLLSPGYLTWRDRLREKAGNQEWEALVGGNWLNKARTVLAVPRSVPTPAIH